jgi:hypothetical protein
MAQFAATPALIGEFSKAGQQRTADEKAAIDRLETGTYGLSDSERLDILRQAMAPIEAQARQARESAARQSLAQGPYSSGQLFKQAGQTQAATAKATGELGLDIARFGTEKARMDKATDEQKRSQRIARLTGIAQAAMPGSGAPAMTGKGWSDPSAAGKGETADDPTTGDDESLQTDAGQAALSAVTKMYGIG